jgi:hypothetical protein
LVQSVIGVALSVVKLTAKKRQSRIFILALTIIPIFAAKQAAGAAKLAPEAIRHKNWIRIVKDGTNRVRYGSTQIVGLEAECICRVDNLIRNERNNEF